MDSNKWGLKIKVRLYRIEFKNSYISMIEATNFNLHLINFVSCFWHTRYFRGGYIFYYDTI